MTQIALITGANRGIGYETARLLSERKMTVLLGARDETLGRKAAETLGVTFVQLDVTDDASIRRAAEWVDAEYGRLDILINNAGLIGDVAAARGLPSGVTRESLHQVFDTNVFGVVAVTNAFLPLLRRADAARIVNVSSEVGSITAVSDPENPLYQLTGIPYPASKTALNMVTAMYAKELRDTPIKVNAANPGYCATDLNEHAGFRTPAQGASVSVELATLPADGPSGQLWGSLTLVDGTDTNGVIPW
ncbi:SDR family oxidoreductase [Cryptosporangium aurantiacum]|uniref:NAD(P)-dependent dehydrogenase, short-chain alcohol dehydrogenase family n=1 Tax=Cryptosporangium aurantiacum TaxID=134849 RepID=A0A1M7MDG2_9ACTN|nr:SDR family oxidoreductase [Cryptosporangium aurantiacum]SHM88921.1 NAD(P)-dependent dehydrogenase, short-chain alcohol dehydrogenase family [Cryptosporangium aurantiacum]